eukprot:2662588-Alexandrium_andersonii.AAC.1
MLSPLAHMCHRHVCRGAIATTIAGDAPIVVAALASSVVLLWLLESELSLPPVTGVGLAVICPKRR